MNSLKRAATMPILMSSDTTFSFVEFHDAVPFFAVACLWVLRQLHSEHVAHAVAFRLQITFVRLRGGDFDGYALGDGEAVARKLVELVGFW